MIHLTGDLYMDSDDNCISIFSWTGTTRMQRGEQVPTIIHRRYYSDLESAFHGIHKIMVLQAVRDSSSIDELLAEYKSIRNKIQDMFWEGPEIMDYDSVHMCKGCSSLVERSQCIKEGTCPSCFSIAQSGLESDLSH